MQQQPQRHRHHHQQHHQTGEKNLSFHNENDKQKQKTLSNQDKHLREGEKKGTRVCESAGGRRSSNCHLFAITTSWLCA